MWLAPFSTVAIEQPGQNLSDMMNETKRLFERQRAIDAMLRGEADAETVLDMLAQHMIDPSAYVDSVEENLEFLWDGKASDL